MDPLPGSEKVRERPGAVEEIEGKGEKEGRGNIGHRAGQLTTKGVTATLGWRGTRTR